MKNFTMKSIFAFLATAMLAMMLVGCGGEKRRLLLLMPLRAVNGL